MKFLVNTNSYLTAGIIWAILGLVAWKFLEWYSLALIAGFGAFGCGFTVLSVYVTYFNLSKFEKQKRTGMN